MGLLSVDDILEMIKALGTDETWDYTPKEGGASIPVSVIPYNEYQATILQGEEIANTDPFVIVPESQLTGTVKGGLISDGTTTYKILRPEPDGEGFSIIGLSKVAA